MLVSLLRHGDVEGGQCFRGHQDDPLDAMGWQQMWTTTYRQQWDYIVTSPLQRCADFARQLAEKLDVTVDQDDRLKELYFGTWEGKTASEIMLENADRLSQFWQSPQTFCAPQGEMLVDFESRVIAAWQDIIKRTEYQRILLVTHGGVIRILLWHLVYQCQGNLMEIQVDHAEMINLEVTDNTVRLCD
jgi:alpha-ribazole phosphatase